MTYRKEELLARLQLLSGDMAKLYQDPCINYRGRTADTGEYDTEVIAAYLLEHLDLFEKIETISRTSSYRVGGHDGTPEHSNSGREELIAMAVFRQKTLPPLGTILDYQIPLKNAQKDKAGKLDLLAYDGALLRILELKRPDSRETMLRCVLEGYTYLRTVDRHKLLRDFALPPETPVKACPLVFCGGAQWRELRQERPQLKRLMAALDCEPFCVTREDGLYRIAADGKGTEA